MANTDNLTRADQVRQRRKIQPVQRKPISRTQDRTSREAQSASRVISRHGNYRSTSSRATTNRRKSVYLATGTPGSEVRLPALPKLSFSWRMLSALIAVGMVVLLYMMRNGDTFRVNEVNLSGGIRVPAEEVKAILNVSGESIIFVQPSQVEEQILATFPDIKNAHVNISMPNGLDVVVEERIPAILWFENEEQLYWIDQDGYTFTVRGEANLPIRVYSDTTPPHSLGFVDPETAAEQAEEGEIARDLPPIDPKFVSVIQRLNTIKPADTPMVYNQQNGLGWTDPHGWQVFFGTSTEDIELKLNEYNYIVEAILEKNLQPILISMEFLHAPFYRLEP